MIEKVGMASSKSCGIFEEKKKSLVRYSRFPISHSKETKLRIYSPINQNQLVQPACAMSL